MSKCYVVFKGKETGIFDTWDICKGATQGVAGSLYVSCESKEVAEELWNKAKMTDEAYENNEFKTGNEKIPEGVCVVYIAGSEKKANRYKVVYTIRTSNEVITKDDYIDVPTIPNGKNGESEIDALMMALYECVFTYGCYKIIVVNHCNSTYAFAKGIWKPKNALTEEFTKVVNECYADVLFASDDNIMRNDEYDKTCMRLLRA